MRSTEVGEGAGPTEVGASESAANPVSIGLLRRRFTKSYRAPAGDTSSRTSRFRFLWAIAVMLELEVVELEKGRIDT